VEGLRLRGVFPMAWEVFMGFSRDKEQENIIIISIKN